jgi:antitoxin MazE
MKANLIAIGNSRGIRIPKAILDQVGFTDEAELDVRDGQIIIRPSRWDEKEWTW